MKLTELLDQIDRLDQQATKGPWVVDKDNPRGIHDPLVIYPPEDDGGVIAYVQPDQDDAEFISLSRSALPKLAKVIDGLIEHCHNVMSWETPRGHEERIAVESRKQGARAVYKAITDAMEADDD